MIKTKIEFTCTWTKEKVQKLLNSLIIEDNVTELEVSMIFMPNEPTATKEPAEVHAPEPKHIKTEPVDVPQPTKEDPVEKAETFTEIKRIHDVELGKKHNTAKTTTTYAKTSDGRVTLYYNNEAVIHTTLDTVRALPEKIPASMIQHMYSGKRAALREFKKHLTDIDKLENDTSQKYDIGIDPYAPILTGGARTDTHASGKVEAHYE